MVGCSSYAFFFHRLHSQEFVPTLTGRLSVQKPWPLVVSPPRPPPRTHLPWFRHAPRVRDVCTFFSIHQDDSCFRVLRWREKLVPLQHLSGVGLELEPPARCNVGAFPLICPPPSEGYPPVFGNPFFKLEGVPIAIPTLPEEIDTRYESPRVLETDTIDRDRCPVSTPAFGEGFRFELNTADNKKRYRVSTLRVQRRYCRWKPIRGIGILVGRYSC